MPFLNEVREVGGVIPFSDVEFTIGDESSDTVNVAVQLLGEDGKELPEQVMVEAYLSDSATTPTQSATAPDTSVEIGTNGTVIEAVTAKLKWRIWTDAYGRFDLDITDAGGDTWYLVVVNPASGELHISSAITLDAVSDSSQSA